MSVNLSLVLVTGVLFGTGFYLMMERSLTRVLLGFLLLGNGVNLLLLQMGGRAGEAPLTESGTPPQDMADPLPQVLILTAIVITFASAAFVLALIYRSWRLEQLDTVSDDPEDRDVADASRATAADGGPCGDPDGPATDFAGDGR